MSLSADQQKEFAKLQKLFSDMRKKALFFDSRKNTWNKINHSLKFGFYGHNTKEQEKACRVCDALEIKLEDYRATAKIAELKWSNLSLKLSKI